MKLTTRGDLIIWKGERYIFLKGRKYIDYLGNEGDLLLSINTDEEDIKRILSLLSDDEIASLGIGQFIHTKNYNI